MIKEYFEVVLPHNELFKIRRWIDNKHINYRGIVLIVHGMAEHIDRYDNFGFSLAKAGYIVYGYNQRGHKEHLINKDDYGYISDNDGFKVLVNDLSSIYNKLKDLYPHLPIFLFGHSMGSFVQQRFIQLKKQNFDGLILSGSARNPNLRLYFGLLVAKISVMFYGRRYRSKILNKLIFESYNKLFKPNRTSLDWLNRDKKEVDKYDKDDYCGGLFTNSYYKDFFKCLIKINNNNNLINKNLPILLISGSDDPVGGMGKFVKSLYNSYKKLKIKDVKILLYNGARHEILLETNKEEIYSDIIKWLNNHIKLENYENIS